MKKGSLVLSLLFFLLSLVNPLFSYGEEPDLGGSGGLSEMFIHISPNPVPKDSNFKITIGGIGFGGLNIKITDQGKEVMEMGYSNSANKCETSSKNKYVQSQSCNAAKDQYTSWSINLQMNGKEFAGGKIYNITVRNTASNAQVTSVFNTSLNTNVNAKPQSICKLENGVCREVNTGLGRIDPDPMKVISTVLRYLIGISGGLFLLIIIRAGYRMITSQGNPEQVKEARESLISAVTGFIFLLFAFIVLEIIGVDLFQLPGFGA